MKLGRLTEAKYSAKGQLVDTYYVLFDLGNKTKPYVTRTLGSITHYGRPITEEMIFDDKEAAERHLKYIKQRNLNRYEELEQSKEQGVQNIEYVNDVMREINYQQEVLKRVVVVAVTARVV